jgi:hypothetical protein
LQPRPIVKMSVYVMYFTIGTPLAVYLRRCLLSDGGNRNDRPLTAPGTVDNRNR